MAQKFHPSFTDKTDYENSSRGFIGSLKPCIIQTADGRIVYNNEKYSFLQDAECPPTCNPKLWRQSQLTAMHGLFEVTSGIYQVRGFDLANITLVEGQRGVLIVDPLTSVECAKAALDLYRQHRGNRQVTGVIYSHSHVDHFGGAQGVIPHDLLESSAKIPIIAPQGFMEEATSENIYVGPAMSRRAVYMYGTRLPQGPTGQVGCGIGAAVSTGTRSLIPPNDLVSYTGEERTIDGIHIQFQLVPETEAPAEMNFFFTKQRALYIAECATHSLHNVITLRGALVRDAKAWARYLDESLVLYGEQTDVLFSGHNWPTWGQQECSRLIAEQRDLYAYLHDQTVRMMNLGMTGIEIAETLILPEALQKAWHAQGFYGSVSHNVKGIYQRYMGWFDGDPAHLWEYPPRENAIRYVACMGGIDEVVRKAEKYISEGDLRFAATLLGHAIAVDCQHEQSRISLADVFEKLGFGAENSTWRNFYLSAAQKLRAPDDHSTSQRQIAQGFSRSQSVEQWWALLSVQLDGPKVEGEKFIIDVQISDEKEWRLILSNGVLTYRSNTTTCSGETAGLVIVVDKDSLCRVLNRRADLDMLNCQGDREMLSKLLAATAPVTESR